MPKEVKTIVKLQIPAGKATPAQPIGPALGQHGLNIGEFVKKFNEATADKGADIIPVEITVYVDRTYDFVLKTPPASDLLRKAAGVEKGSGEPNKTKVGGVSAQKVREIAERKMPDLNPNAGDQAAKIIAGTARPRGMGGPEKGLLNSFLENVQNPQRGFYTRRPRSFSPPAGGETMQTPRTSACLPVGRFPEKLSSLKIFSK